MKADQAARDRARAGRRPTAEELEGVITLGVKGNGDPDLGRDSQPPTPEQIARGDDAPSGAA